MSTNAQQAAPELQWRLVSILGLGRRGPDGSYDYDKTRYAPAGISSADFIDTKYLAHALSKIYRPTEVWILSTKEAEAVHRAGLETHLAELGLQPRFQRVPEGRMESELWQQFAALKKAFRGAQGVILDVTHGFRSLPFFGAAAVSFIRAVDSDPPKFQIKYGAYEAQVDGVTPIWDLTPFIDLLDWSHALILFLRTGRAEDVVEPLHAVGNHLAREWAQQAERGPTSTSRPAVDLLAKAIQRFGDDMVTLRTGSLLLGQERRLSSAAALVETVREARDLVSVELPPFADVLDRVEAMARPLVLESPSTLGSPAGERAMAALARLYLDMARYPEAAITLREAWVTRFASAAAACPGRQTFDLEARLEAETSWHDAEEKVSLAVSQIRNDIEHGGFRASPARPGRLKKVLEELVRELQDTAGSDSRPAHAAELSVSKET